MGFRRLHQVGRFHQRGQTLALTRLVQRADQLGTGFGQGRLGRQGCQKGEEDGAKEPKFAQGTTFMSRNS